MKTHLIIIAIFGSLLTLTSPTFSQFTIYNSGNTNLVSNNCSRIALDYNMKPWIGHPNNGASVMDSSGTSFTNYSFSNSPLFGEFVSFMLLDGNRMWVNEFHRGLYIHEENFWSSIPWDPYLSLYGNFTAYGMYKTGNYLWIATKEGGIFKYDVTTSKYIVYDNSNGLPTNYMLRITGDTLGNIYAGTGFQGALKFNGYIWTNYTTYNSPLPSNNVFSVACDGYGNVWFGTDQGLAKLSSIGAWTIYDSITTGIPGNYIRTIVPRNNNLVVAIGYGGLGILNINTDVWTVFNTQNSNLPVNTVFDAAVSDSGDVWITLVDHGIAVLPQFLPGGVPNVSNDNRFNIYPNPSGKVVNIEYSGTIIGSYTIEIITIDGKRVLKTTGRVVHGSVLKTLDVSKLSSGLYILKIYGNNSVATRKLVIE